MDASFYTAARGAMTEQDRMDVISNNFANINTVGYKAKSTAFMDLLYYNMHDMEGVQSGITTGTGVKVQHTNTDFITSGGLTEARDGSAFNYSIKDSEGFFMVRSQTDGAVTYTRAGDFHQSLHADGYYLETDANKLVLDTNGNPIRVVDGEVMAQPGVFTFNNTNGMLSVGTNEFSPVAKNGNPIRVADANLVNGYLEMSNVDAAQEMSDTIITSRAYSMALKMIQTSDDIVQTINNLR